MLMKFGLHFQLPCSENQSPVARYRDTIEQCVHAERLGFESVWPVEQHFNPDLSILPSPLLLLAAVAERTRTLRLGIAIVLLPLSHPVRVAEEIATLDVISGGRVEFGIGRGAIPSHFAGFGVPQAESRERFFEGLDLILRAWTSERVSYSGRFFHCADLAVAPKPVQQPHPPIRVATNSIETFELMGRMGYDIFVATQVNPFPKLREFVPLYRRARDAAGHPKRAGEDLTLLCPLYVAASRERIREELEPSISHFIRTAANLFAGIATEPEGGAIRLQKVVERARRLTYDKVADLMGVFDTPEMCVDRLKRIQEEFNPGRLICWFNPGGMTPHDKVMRSMELFAAKVMPHFQ
jgi:alkanesulfonate monooxygenase SsuD/methylene tetrahydromethanopterin reductase-like flavin-dependent oxidoreductase (luciferase family)